MRLGKMGAAVLAGVASLAWSSETRVYRAQHRAIAELAPLAEAALGDEGRVAVDARTASLILVGKPAALDRAIALLRAQDAAVETVLLDYRIERRAVLEATDLRVDWALEVGGVRIGRVGGGGDGLRVALRSVESSGDSTLSGSLRLLSGGAGYIVTGDAIPVVATSPYASSTEFIRAESGFEVRVSVLGSGDVALELQAFDGRLMGGGVRYAAALTELTVAPGETLVVGSIGRELDSRNVDRLAGVSTRAGHDEQVLLVSVAVADPARP